MSLDLIALLHEKTSNRCKSFYSIMPLVNIPSVVQLGILSYDRAQEHPHKSIALDSVQARRDRVIIPNGQRLHSYANLYFTYLNPMMYKRKDIAETFCILAVDLRVLLIEGCVLADQNAARDLVKFYTPENGLNNIDFDLVFARSWVDDNPYAQSLKKAIKCAEILIPDSIPYEYIIGAFAVSHEAREQLQGKGFHKEIIVNPRAFYR